MLSKCANPACCASFQYLREGRLYKFETHTNPVVDTDKKVPRKVEHFWLCGQCARMMTLTMGDHKVQLVPLKRSAVHRAAAS